MDVKEHFYVDDPREGPADVRTTLPDVAYFFLRDGDLQAAVQGGIGPRPHHQRVRFARVLVQGRVRADLPRLDDGAARLAIDR